MNLIFRSRPKKRGVLFSQANGEAAAGCHIYIEQVALADDFLLDDLAELVVAVVGVVAVAVNFGGIIDVLVEKIYVKFDVAADFIGDAADVPIVAVAVFARYHVAFADFAEERHGFFPVYWHGADELEGFGMQFFVDVGAVGRHVHG